MCQIDTIACKMACIVRHDPANFTFMSVRPYVCVSVCSRTLRHHFSHASLESMFKFHMCIAFDGSIFFFWQNDKAADIVKMI